MRRLGKKVPKIAVAGLNPHSGEAGLFGREEIEKIAPAVEQAIAEGLQVTGPVPPDTVFLKAYRGVYDIVVAMYHDQGHIPMKMIAFDSGVNVTLGLPIIRTSVDHGTAFDIAGKGIANEESMLYAVDLGKRFAES
jgi:4-hydroxythreonine-4-phosphate dehydrogenase